MLNHSAIRGDELRPGPSLRQAGRHLNSSSVAVQSEECFRFGPLTKEWCVRLGLDETAGRVERGVPLNVRIRAKSEVSKASACSLMLGGLDERPTKTLPRSIREYGQLLEVRVPVADENVGETHDPSLGRMRNQDEAGHRCSSFPARSSSPLGRVKQVEQDRVRCNFDFLKTR